MIRIVSWEQAFFLSKKMLFEKAPNAFIFHYSVLWFLHVLIATILMSLKCGIVSE